VASKARVVAYQSKLVKIPTSFAPLKNIHDQTFFNFAIF